MSQLETELIEKFVPLVKWASMKFSFKTGNYQNFQAFYDKGVETFAVCLHKWKTLPCFKSKFKTAAGKIEFEKYFKEALFTNFLQLQIHICSIGKKYNFISLESLIGNKSLSNTLTRFQHNYGIDKQQMMQGLTYDGGFKDLDYKELVKEVEHALKGLDLIIFRILIEPPEELKLRILRENARKMRHFDITGNKKKGLNSVRMTKSHVFKYLNTNGKKISYSEFNKSMKNIKSITLNVIKNSH